MGRSRDLQHYPPEYLDICEAVGIRAEIKMIPFENPQEANSLRGHFYAFLGALKDRAVASERKQKETRLSEGEMDLLEKYKFSRLVQVTIERIDGKPTVVFQNRENSWQAQAMRRAITKRPGAADDHKTPIVERDLGPDRELTIEEQLELVRKTTPGRR